MAHEGMALTLIACGGTIDKDYPRRSGAYAFEISANPASSKIVSQAEASGLSVKVIPLMQKDSLDMTDDDVKVLRETIVDEAKAGSSILVTHGTSTLIKSALSAAEGLKAAGINGARVVFTGSHVPAAFTESDAQFNVAFAIGALAALEQTQGAGGLLGGTFISLRGRLIPVYQCEQDPVSGEFSRSLPLPNSD